MGRNSFYILSCGFTFLALNFKFSSTTVVSALQIHLFMQNEPNFRKSQMNVTNAITKEYGKWTLGEHGKNEPKTNPIKANLLNAQMNVNKVLTKEYEKKLNWALYENEPNSNPKQTQFYNPKGLQQWAKNCLLKISCLMAQGFLCWDHGLFMIWKKKNFLGKISNEKIDWLVICSSSGLSADGIFIL